MSDIVYCPPNVDCPCYVKMADEITALRAEIKRLEAWASGERTEGAHEGYDSAMQSIRDWSVEMARLRAENERLRGVVNILQSAMTAKKPIPMAFKKAIIEAAALAAQPKENSDEL